MCNSSWFNHGNIARVQSLLKDLISPTRFSNLPPAIKWGIECEPKAVAHYLDLHSDEGITVQECGLFLHPVHRFLGVTPDRLVEDPTSYVSGGVLESLLVKQGEGESGRGRTHHLSCCS